jgi:hypothetical protein
MKYEYIVEERSVDVRTFKVVSDKKLSDDEIYEYYPTASFNEHTVYTADYNPKVTVQYEGTEYGDDSQVNITRINQ